MTARVAVPAGGVAWVDAGDSVAGWDMAVSVRATNSVPAASAAPASAVEVVTDVGVNVDSASGV